MQSWPLASRTSTMSDQLVVIGTYGVVYVSILGYALYLHRRRKRAER